MLLFACGKTGQPVQVVKGVSHFVFTAIKSNPLKVIVRDM